MKQLFSYLKIGDVELKVGSNLERVLESNDFAVTIEIASTSSPNPTDFVEKAKKLKGYGDAYNVTDNQMAKVRLSSFASAVLCLREGLEPIMQMVCRDRNRIALQSDILGASAAGIRNVLCLMGDPLKLGNQKDAKVVFDLDTVRQIEMIKDMRDSKVLLGGAALPEGVKIYIGAAADPFAEDLEIQLQKIEKKVEAGADFIQTQAIYDIDGLEEWMDLVRERDIHNRSHILCGIIPIKSPKRAAFLNEKVAGIKIPEEILNRIQKAENPEEEGVRISLELIERLKRLKGLRGIHIMPVGWEDAVPRIAEMAGLVPRPEL